MSAAELQHKETLLIEALLSGLEVREAARSAGASMLLYLAELIVQCAHKDLAAIRARMDVHEGEPRSGDADNRTS